MRRHTFVTDQQPPIDIIPKATNVHNDDPYQSKLLMCWWNCTYITDMALFDWLSSFRWGSPKSVVVSKNIDAVRNMFEEVLHMTYNEIVASLEIS